MIIKLGEVIEALRKKEGQDFEGYLKLYIKQSTGTEKKLTELNNDEIEYLTNFIKNKLWRGKGAWH